MAEDRPLLILSGIGPGHTGVGRLIAHLQATASPDDRIIFRQAKGRSPRMLLATGRWAELTGELWARWRQRSRWSRTWAGLDAAGHAGLVLVHPQSLGSDLVLVLIARRRETAVYVMDHAGFCRSSYNHRAGATCLDCVGTDGSPGRRQNCPAFPESAASADRLVAGFAPLARTGKVRFLVQNRGQGELIRRHVDADVRLAEVGLWSDDWEMAPTGASSGEEVVFHGTDHPAKGSRWAIEVARSLPGRSFLFPFPLPSGVVAPPNARFRPCTWETGLGAAVRDARITVAPSLWSAPIEGALVKSLRWSRAVALRAEPWSYAADLPSGLGLSLHRDPMIAASQLDAAIRDGWRPDADAIGSWWRALRGDRPLIERLRSAIHD
jgi:hypothetical protein